MITTLTPNPCIDKTVAVEKFDIYKMNRVRVLRTDACGKGINVSKILREFGLDSICLGFIAGRTGRMIKDMLEDLPSDFIELQEGSSRINVKLHEGGILTEINGKGPDIGPGALDMLYKRLSGLKEDDLLIISGSIPGSVTESDLMRLGQFLNGKSIPFVADSASSQAVCLMDFGPRLIKPNIDELSALFSKDIDPLDADLILKAMTDLKARGAEEVIVSAGSIGAYLLDKGGSFFFLTAPEGKAEDPVGAGDSMLAAYIACKKRGLASDKALETAVMAGSACAFKIGLPTLEDIKRLSGT